MSSVYLHRRTAAVVVTTTLVLVLFYTLFHASNRNIQAPLRSLCINSGFYEGSLEEPQGDIPDLSIPDGALSAAEDPQILAEVFPEPFPFAVNKHKSLKGDPTPHFRDNLLPDIKYITGWHDGGFTNQFMAITNLIYLSTLLSHIPIIPGFVARPHVPVQAGYRAVSDVFDVDRWARAVGKDILEWKDVKDLRGLQNRRADDGTLGADERDELGCWIPRAARLFQIGRDEDLHLTFSGLATLAQSTAAKPNPLSSEELGAIYPAQKSGHKRLPDTLTRRVLALTLGLSESQILAPWRGDHDWDERKDGVRYTTSRDYYATLDERDRILTPYILVHARHGDFLNNCDSRKAQGKPCSPPLSSIAQYVKEVEDELKQKGIIKEDHGWSKDKTPVIVTSDEADSAWWNQVKAHGWKRVVFPKELELPPGVKGREDGLDPETHKKLWDRMFIEVAIQGFATGFVGTQGSTMSLVAQRRVEHWQGGVARTMSFSIWQEWDL
ncbi:hypothetical protein PIIN_03040 [Serendipita indica DSM 11827]|uniref:Uncharacterized protein n=1 Tax=Serendipita indica (strain DSM 11827) TaxID=1109443 RepID=G4TCU8_SERID|nr:hypothetical protein PIIN_03040 [Serendipita indica DSM 11827]